MSIYCRANAAVVPQHAESKLIQQEGNAFPNWLEPLSKSKQYLFGNQSFWYKLKQHKCTKMVFTSSVVCTWATKTFLSEIIFFILKPTSSIQNNKNILGAYSSLFSQGRETVYTSSENTCIEMSCIKMTSNPHTIFVLQISRQDNTISIWSLAPAGTYMFYKNKKIMWVISKHNCTWISDWIYVTMGSLSLYRW